MENEQHRYALRIRNSGSRSRSQTPSIQTRVTMEIDSSEHHYDLRSRSRERSHTPAELIPLKKTSGKPSPSSLAKLPDQSTRVVSETKQETSITKISESQSDNSRDSTPLARKSERYATRHKSKKQMVPNGQGESSTKQSSDSSRRVITSDYSSEEGESRDDPPSRPHSAREIYKQAGDWWNVFPKTDYTYSKASQCRYEIAPGILAMPNMSRRSLHSDGDSALASEISLSNQPSTTDISGNSESHFLKEVVLRERRVQEHQQHRDISYVDAGLTERMTQYPSGTSTSFQAHQSRTNSAAYIDSDAEIEESTSLSRTWRISWLFNSFTAIIVIWFRRILGFLEPGRRTGQGTTSYKYQTYYESIWSKLSRKVDGFAQYLYFCVVKIFLFDSWLLSKICNSRQKLQERGSKFTWILLLAPLLLVLGAYSVQMQSFVRLDSLVEFSYNFTETLNRCIDETQGTSRIRKKGDSGWVIVHLEQRNGSWCLPCILAHNSAEVLIGSLARTAQRISSSYSDPESHTFRNKRTNLPHHENDQSKELEEILDHLEARMNDLELSSLKGTELLTNLARSLQTLMEQKGNQSTAKVLDEKMNISADDLVNIPDFAALRLELESLKEQWIHLKSCCKSHFDQFEKSNPVERQNNLAAVAPDRSNDPASTKLHLMKMVENLLSFGKAENVETNDKPNTVDDRIFSTLADSRVREIVAEMLRIYDADKTGRVDYALESAGGLIISTRCTQRYDLKQMAVKILSFTLYYETNNPRTVIQGNPIQPGTCWAFQGFPGYLLIKLRSFVHVTGFTLEHAPKSILPNEEMKSAPRKFNVWGFTAEVDPDPVLLGDYEFLDSDESLQYFPLQNTAITQPFEYVELRVHSNHGQLEYTCLYRFRVHGKPAYS